MRLRRMLAVLLAAVMLMSFCSCVGIPGKATDDEAKKLLSKYSEMPLSGEDIGIGVHDDEYGFHIVNRIEFTHPQTYQSKHIAHSYQTLSSDSQKSVYDKVIDACYCFSDKKDESDNNYEMRPVILSGTDYGFRETEAAIVAALDDHPEIFWMDYLFDLTFITDSDTTVLTLYSLYTADDVVRMMRELDDALNTIYADIPKDLSEYEREVAVYKYMIDHCEYDENITSSEEYESEHPSLFNLYGALVDQKAVCEGYARAFDYLCSELGVDTVCISGTVESDPDGNDTSDELHLWNAVMLDGEWYMADVTWDDLDEDEDIRDVFVYLNITSKTMEQDHTLDQTYRQITDDDYWKLECYINNFLPPACTATDYCYYMREGVRLSEPDVDVLSEGIVQAAEKKSSALIVYVEPDTYTPQEMSDALFDGDQPYYEAMEKADAALEDSPLDVYADAVYYCYEDRELIAFEMPYE